MVSIETVDQKYFINENEVKNWSDTDGYLYNLLFIDCNVVDENWNEYVIPSLSEFYSIGEWKEFKTALMQKIEQLKKYTKIWIDKLEKIQSGYMSEEDAKAYWDESDEDMYPRDSFDAFEDWYESGSYYEWESESRNDDLDSINKEFPEFDDKIDTDMYFDSSHSGQYYWHTIEKRFDEMKEDSLSTIASIDKQIEEAIEEHKYDAIEYIFEY